MADPASAMMAIGTGVQAGQGIASGASGKRAASAAQQRQQQYDDRVGGMVDQAGGMLLGEGGALQQMMGPGLGAGQELFGRAVTGGQDFANQMNQYQQQLMGAVPGGGGGMMQPAVMPGGGGGMMNHQMMRDLGPDASAAQVEQAWLEDMMGHQMMQGGGGGLVQHMGMGMGGNQGFFDFNAPGMAEGRAGAGAAMEGLQGAMPGMGIAEQAAQGSMQSPQGYDFGAGRQLQAQTMDTFQQQADAARQTGLENVGQAFTGSQDALSAALASQGISPTSGVAAQALGDVAMQGAGQRAQLERDIAGAAGQTALQGAQFDVGTQLQREGMESGFGLGLQGLGLQGLGQAGQLGLGMAGQDLSRLTGLGNLGLGMTGLGQDFALGREGLRGNFELGRAGQQSQNIVNAANLARFGYTDPLAMQQDIYGQNILNPFMAGAGGLQNLLSTGLAGMGSSLDRSERQVGAAGQGKGAAMGSAFDPARSQQKGG